MPSTPTSNDAQRAQALLAQRGATIACVGTKPPAHRRALRLKSLWTGIALIATVAGALHFIGGKHHVEAPSSPSVATTHAAHQEALIKATQTPATTKATIANAPTASVVAKNVVVSNPPTVTPTVAQTAQVVPLPAAVRPVAPVVNVAPTSNLTPLPITVTSEDTKLSLAQKLFDKGLEFPALATSIEDPKTNVYYDGGGANIGMGYCITVRIAIHGRDQVKQEFLKAGISEHMSDVLMSKKRRIQEKGVITMEQALRLLIEVAPEYEAIARDAVGPMFDKLPKHRQAAVTWLAYNTGDVASFKGLVHGVQNDNARQAMEHMTPWFRDMPNQVMVKNERAGAYLQSAYYSEAGLKMAITEPAKFEDRTLIHKESPITVVDPAAAKILRKEGKLPVSPTTGPSTKPLPGAVAVAAILHEPLPKVDHFRGKRINVEKVARWQSERTPTTTTEEALISRSVGMRQP